ncbi:MAG: S49 family peptidase [Planctomycetota bacterium]|nr:MAG: S49 family peptidase [Planctomycetota bacterium]
MPSFTLALRTHFLSAALMFCAALTSPLGAGDEDAQWEGSVIVTLRGDLPLIGQQSWTNPFAEPLTRHQANEQLRRALRAPEEHVVLDLSQGFFPSLAAAEELADTLRRRPEHKRVTVLLENVSDAAMVIAAAADEVAMAEAGLIWISGLSMQVDHYTEMLGKLGIRFAAVTSGEQKSAPEPLTLPEPSAAALAEYRDLLGQIDESLLSLSARDNLDTDALRAARASAPQTSALAKQLGLIDRSVDPQSFFHQLQEPSRHLESGGSAPDLESFTGIMNWWRQMMSGPRQTRHPQVVAVVQWEGMIVDGEGDVHQGLIGAGESVRLLEQLADDSRVVAVVLRINSGGGSAGASDRIYHAIRRLDAKKPVIALFDDIAASGGYYLGIGARQIVAHQSTITGSIGVFAMLPDLSGTRSLLGIHRTTLRTDPRADLFATNAIDDERLAAMQAVVDDMDQRFRELVGQRRGLAPEAVKALAQGRIFGGNAAHKHGLVDALGTLPDAVELARNAAEIDRPLPLRIYPQRRGLADMLGLGPLAQLPPWLRHLAGLGGAGQNPIGEGQLWSWRALPQIR